MPESAAAQSNYGTGLKAAGRLDEAFTQFDMALQLDPTYARAYNNMGNAFQAKGEFERAVNAHGTAIALMPTLASAYSNLGNALREVGKNELAVTALMSAVQLNPNFASAYTNLGSATMALGDAKMASKWHGLAAALNGFRDASSLNNLGAALELQGKLGEAADAFDAALKVQPGAAVLHLNRGNVHRRLGELSEAVQSYTKCLELEPDGADKHIVYNNVAAALLAEGELERALEAYDAALARKPDYTVAIQNRDKVPIAAAYVSAAAHETKVLASRAARSLLAAAGARRAESRSAGFGEPLGAMMAPTLHRVIRFLRRLETKQLTTRLADRLWSGRGKEMPGAITQSGSDGGAADPEDFSLSAFAWGGVWLHSLAACFTHPEARAAMLPSPSDPTATPPSAVVLGSSIGFEAYLAALTFGAPTVGVELLCGLTGISEEVRGAHGVPTSLAKFECADALTYALPRNTGLVYVDDTAWDVPTIRQVANRLARVLPRGAIVVHNALAGYADSTSYRALQSYPVATSWNPVHEVHVHAVV